MSMSFTLSKPLIDYTRAVRQWSVAECRPYARETDRRHALPDNWRDILATAPVPLDGGHQSEGEPAPQFEDGYWVSRLAFYEAVAYGDIWAAQALGNGIGHLVVQAMGTPEQIERWSRPCVEEGWVTGFALTEPHFGSDTSQVATTATRDGNSWVINGTKIFCSYGAVADYVVVFATVDKSLGGRGIQAFVIDKGTPGFVIGKENEHKMGIRSWMTSELVFTDCRIPVDRALGWRDGTLDSDRSGQAAALEALGRNRPNIAGVATGIAQAALDLTTQLLKEQQMDFTRHRWAHVEDELTAMNCALDRGRRVARRAQYLLDQGRPDRTAAATAKAFAPQTCERVIRRCMQLLGPDGMSEDLLLEKWYRDMKIMDIFEGSGQIQRLVVSRALMP
jgi:acyl-CoA dehydrogenase